MKFKVSTASTGAAAITAFLVAGAAIAAVVGWVLNIIAIFGMLGGEVTTLLVVRLIGVPVGILGSILGLFY